MKKHYILTGILLGFFFGKMAAQDHTVGLLSYDPNLSYSGYTLIYPHNQPNVYLLNNCGEIVHTWTDEPQYRPGNTAYIMPNGNLVKTKRLAAVTNDPIWAGGGGGIIEIRSWDNDLIWSFELNNAQHRLHHDITVTPQGTILALVWEKKTLAEAVQAGRDPNLTLDGELWPERIIEIDPATNDIIWDWHLWDHLVQDFDPTKDNYGIVADNPGRMDVNLSANTGGKSWLHANAIDYNADLDQILVSSPFLNECYILDHSTTTAQAATQNGGLSGKGGNFMYRWGNPANYDRGTAADQTMFFNHGVNWVDDFVSTGHPHYGKIAFFNNRFGMDYSSFSVFTPTWDMYTWEYTSDNTGRWGPPSFDLNLTHPQPSSAYAAMLSNVQWLDNGNLFVCSGTLGYLFEMTPDNKIAWEYKIPLKAGLPVAQGETLANNDNQNFRAFRYPVDYQAFESHDLSRKGWIEMGADSTFCDQLLPVSNPMGGHVISIAPNPANGSMVTIEWHGGIWVEVEILDLLGRPVVEAMRLTGGRKYLDISHLETGMYFVRVNGGESSKLLVVR